MLRNSCGGVVVVGKGKLLLLQRRGCQSMFHKEGELKPTPSSSAGFMVTSAENSIGIAFKLAMGGAGFVLGGLISRGESPEVTKDIESTAEGIKRIENHEIQLEDMLVELRKMQALSRDKNQID